MDRTSASDEELMTLYATHGEERAFRELYERHKNRVWAYLRKRLKSSEEASEVFQRVFLKLHKTRALFNPQWPFLPWLFQICYHELVSFWRTEKKYQGLVSWEDWLTQNHNKTTEFSFPPQETRSPEAQVEQVMNSAAYQALSSREREVLASRFFDEKSFSDMAVALETSEANVRQILSRALRKLRRAYAKDS